jgi:uncharacterized protein with LGFP repeats
MTPFRRRRSLSVAALTAVALLAAGCSTDTAGDAASSATAAAGSAVTPAAGSPADAAPSTASTSTASTPAAADPAGELTLSGVQGREVTLTGPVAAKYAAATEAQKAALGKPLDGDHNAGTRDSGVVFQQFRGGVIVAENDDPGTPAYITWGRIRDAWNVERLPDGNPTRGADGANGSAGPLGVPTSDEVADGSVRTTTFQHGRVSYDTANGAVTVVVNGREVPSGL